MVGNIGFEGQGLTLAEEQYLLLPYNEILDSIQNYADTAIQFGFMTLFITALPIASTFSFINGVVKVKTNSWKLTKVL